MEYAILLHEESTGWMGIVQKGDESRFTQPYNFPDPANSRTMAMIEAEMLCDNWRAECLATAAAG